MMPKLLMLGLTEYFKLYNHERPHHALSDRKPDEVYQTVSGGGAKIVERFSSNSEASKVVTGQCLAAEIEEMETT